MKQLMIGTPEYNAVKEEILSTHSVVPTEKFNVEQAIRGRIDYLKNFLRKTGLNGFVLGISGGVDSSTVGRICQLACEELRAEGKEAKFYAMRLPAGIQFDENDAQDAMQFINPDVSMTVNIGEASNIIHNAFISEQTRVEGKAGSAESLDYHKGNVKARMRMIAQYEVAGYYGLGVLISSQNCEVLFGFFTKHGDGAGDIMLNNSLNKRQVRLMAKYLGAPENLWNKAPTADLEELNPGKLDDDGFGVPYNYVDDFLEGINIPPEYEQIIVQAYLNSCHKRDPMPKYKK